MISKALYRRKMQFLLDYSKLVTMEEDISKKTIFVLLILTILVSVLSTWTLIENSSGNGKTVLIKDSPIASANIGLVVQEPPKPPTTEANIELTIN
jgi:hypothetical protein